MMQLNNEHNRIFSGRPVRTSPEYNSLTCQNITRMPSSTNQETFLKQENQELKAQIKQQDLLIKVMAHDLKAPLSSFLSFTRYAGEDITNFSAEELNIIIQDINQHAQGMYDLVENILYWHRASNQLNPVKFPLKKEVASNLKIIEPMAGLKNIQINMKLPENDHVFADRQMTASILRNLLSNAVKHTPSRGKVDVLANRQSNMLQITVKDYGYGMDKEILGNLFDSEKTGRLETKPGLGLLICKKFVELNNGSIWGESTWGKGTSLHFTLPLADC